MKQGNPTIGGQPVILNTVASAVADAARNQALSASLTALIEKNVLGYPTFSTLEAYDAGTTVFHDRRLHTFNVAHAAGAWDGTQVAEANIKDLIPALIKAGLEAGEITPAAADNLASWVGAASTADYTQTLLSDTTGGDLSIDSSVPANLMQLAAKTDFGAASLVATGFNLLRHATPIGTGYYIMVPALPFGAINTSDAPNGVLFTNSEGANLRPTVRFKSLAAGVPNGVSDGEACDYTDATDPITDKQYRFYTTAQPGYLIVSGITFADTCMHIAWSRRYDEFVSPTDEADAGNVVNLSAGINAMHSYGLMLTVGTVSDYIEKTGDNQVTWHRLVERTQPEWATEAETDQEEQPTGNYTHTATIATMKADGTAVFATIAQPLSVSGTTVSYTDQNETPATDYVKFELATPATGTAAVSSSFGVEDWGLIMVTGATGEAYLTIAYAQGIPDSLRGLLSQLDNKSLPVLTEAIVQQAAEIERLKAQVERLYGLLGQ